ncbi:hypothetical protein L596_028307 [Steinernema carpocapsae]|uniref:Uncharacterized protein n=1 Tax=Steinernema carpocapsae TaxID=34508 RepID=A0A4U5LY19_STECR|nr:hypothetical protein L596_028307 [Steinernema carpocapsae]
MSRAKDEMLIGDITANFPHCPNCDSLVCLSDQIERFVHQNRNIFTIGVNVIHGPMICKECGHVFPIMLTTSVFYLLRQSQHVFHKFTAKMTPCTSCGMNQLYTSLFYCKTCHHGHHPEKIGMCERCAIRDHPGEEHELDDLMRKDPVWSKEITKKVLETCRVDIEFEKHCKNVKLLHPVPVTMDELDLTGEQPPISTQKRQDLVSNARNVFQKMNEVRKKNEVRMAVERKMDGSDGESYSDGMSDDVDYFEDSRKMNFWIATKKHMNMPTMKEPESIGKVFEMQDMTKPPEKVEYRLGRPEWHEMKQEEEVMTEGAGFATSISFEL